MAEPISIRAHEYPSDNGKDGEVCSNCKYKVKYNESIFKCDKYPELFYQREKN